MNWQHLKQCGITKREEAETPDVESLLPSVPTLAANSIDDWFDEVLENDSTGLFRAFVADHVGIDFGGRVAVHLCTQANREDGSRLYNFLAAAGLSWLVVVDPFLPFEEEVRQLGDLKILFVREDPLRFLSQMDPGPAVLFTPFYAGGFTDEAAERAYYAALADEVLRVISNSRNIVVAPGAFGSGVPIAAGMNVELLNAMIPRDQDKGEWRFMVAQYVIVDSAKVVAIAFKAKDDEKSAGPNWLDEP